MLRLALALIALSTPAIGAEPGRACVIERLTQAKAACLEVEAETRAAGIEARIATATSDLQAAYGPEIRAFEAELAASQARWRYEVDQVCRTRAAGDAVAFQTCRLAETVARSEQVDESLAIARERLGALTAADLGLDNVEVLIPLPNAPGGPAADLRVPLVVPVRP